MREPFNDMTGPEILGEVFARLRILSDGELGKADELLRIAKEMMPHARVNDSSFGICNIAGTMQKAEHRQKVGMAYLWAIQDIKSFLGIEVSDEEFEIALKNHPTEKSQ